MSVADKMTARDGPACGGREIGASFGMGGLAGLEYHVIIDYIHAVPRQSKNNH
jgi:hypothetical protein